MDRDETLDLATQLHDMIPDVPRDEEPPPMDPDQLDEHERTGLPSELADELGISEHQVRIDHNDRRNVHTVLTRTHLPKLDDLDVYIEVLRRREIPWSLYYVGLAVLVGLVQVAVAVGVPGFVALGGTAVAAFVVTAFAVSAALRHYYGERARLGNLEKPPELRERG